MRVHLDDVLMQEVATTSADFEATARLGVELDLQPVQLLAGGGADAPAAPTRRGWRTPGRFPPTLSPVRGTAMGLASVAAGHPGGMPAGLAASCWPKTGPRGPHNPAAPF
jgi:hypothetical protein